MSRAREFIRLQWNHCPWSIQHPCVITVVTSVRFKNMFAISCSKSGFYDELDVVQLHVILHAQNHTRQLKRFFSSYFPCHHTGWLSLAKVAQDEFSSKPCEFCSLLNFNLIANQFDRGWRRGCSIRAMSKVYEQMQATAMRAKAIGGISPENETFARHSFR